MADVQPQCMRIDVPVPRARKSQVGLTRHARDPDIRALHDARTSTAGGALHIAGAVGTIVVGASALSFVSGLWWAAGYAAFLMLAGSRFRALGNMLHECAHRAFVRSKVANDRFGTFLAIVDFTNFRVYQHEHGTHHRFTGEPVHDLDLASRQRYFARRGSFFWLHLIMPLTLFHLPTYLRPKIYFAEDTRGERMARMSYIAGSCAFAHFAVGWPAFLLYVVVPYVTSYQVLRYWSDAFDHAWLTEAKDRDHRSANHIPSSWLTTFLLFPRHDQYHLVHHVFPAMPVASLRRAHERLLCLDVGYAAMDHRFALQRAVPELPSPLD